MIVVFTLVVHNNRRICTEKTTQNTCSRELNAGIFAYWQ